MTRWLRLALCMLIGIASASSAWAQGEPVPGQWYRIQAKHSFKYLDVAWGSRDEHAAVTQSAFSEWENGAAQLWQLVPDGNGWYRIQVKQSGKYLDVNWGSSEHNAPVSQAAKSDWSDGAAQLWRLVPTGEGWYRLQVKHSGKYLDVTWASREEHAPVGQAGESTAVGGAAQQWRFIPASAGRGSRGAPPPQAEQPAPPPPSNRPTGPPASTLRLQIISVDVDTSRLGEAVFTIVLNQPADVQVNALNGDRERVQTSARQSRTPVPGKAWYDARFMRLPDRTEYNFRVWAKGVSGPAVAHDGSFTTTGRID